MYKIQLFVMKQGWKKTVWKTNFDKEYKIST